MPCASAQRAKGRSKAAQPEEAYFLEIPAARAPKTWFDLCKPEFKKKVGSGVVALIGVEEGKASAVVGVTDDLAKKFSAVELVKAGVAALGGKGGGGRPDMAQGGGPDATKASDALKAIEAALGGAK